MPEVSLESVKTSQPGGLGSLVAIGFSARSLAEAIHLTEILPIAADFFGDQDLRELAQTFPLAKWCNQITVASDPDFFSDIISWLKRCTGSASPLDAKILLAGGTENWLALLRELEQNFAVLGPTCDQMRHLRNLDFWREAAHYAGIGFPESHRSATRGNWLQKSITGAGGLHVRRFSVPATIENNSPPEVQDLYYQAEIRGQSLGVTCILGRPDGFDRSDSGRDKIISDSDRNRNHPNACRILGATGSLSSRDWPGPLEFIYRGSWGPLPLSGKQREQIELLGDYIHSCTGLRGWVQVDFIEDEHGKLWLLELNPRWTAGMEVLLHTGVNPVRHHLDVWQTPAPDASPDRPSHGTSPRAASFAKAVLYTDTDVILNHDCLRVLHGLPRESFADIPSQHMLDETIPTGHPLLTLRAGLPATDPASQTDRKARLASHLRQLLSLRKQVLKTLQPTQLGRRV